MHSKTSLEALREARDLISQPGKFTQEDYARDKNGGSVNVGHEQASCYCALGAVCEVLGISTIDAESDETLSPFDLAQLHPAFNDLGKVAPRVVWHDVGAHHAQHVPAFNDTHTQQEVVELFDKAIARLEG